MKFLSIEGLVIGGALLFALFGTESRTTAPSVSDILDVERSTRDPKQVLLRNCTTTSQAAFLAVGDVMLSRGVHRAMERSKDPMLPFRDLAEEFSSTDLNFCNLESPISGNDSHVGEGMVFNTQTDEISGLAEYNFRIVSLANNHALDQGPGGLRSTHQRLSELGIESVGTGNTIEQAWTPRIIDANGIKIAFIAASYSSINDGGQIRNEYVARIDDRSRLERSIAEARQQADLVIVAMHAGVEYTRRPHTTQIEFARTAIDLGADMIIGSHPHWIQTIERYKGKFIFYSLGNFIFDQRMPGTTEGLMVRAEVVREKCGDERRESVRLNSLKLIPVVIRPGGIPQLADEDRSVAILAKIGVDSATLIP